MWAWSVAVALGMERRNQVQELFRKHNLLDSRLIGCRVEEEKVPQVTITRRQPHQ